MAGIFNLPRSICKSEWEFNPLPTLLLLLLSVTGYAKMSVLVNEFELESSGDIVISTTEMTPLLWRDLDNDTRFEVSYDVADNDSADFVIEGNCIFEGNNYFDINWTISNTSNSYVKEFFYEGNGLKEARKSLSSSLDEMLATVNLATDPDSVSVTIDGLFMGHSPLILNDVPVGWHLFETITSEGLVFQDSFHLTKDSTFFYFALPVTPKSETAYLKLLSPPKCEIYVNGAHLPATYNMIYELLPGQSEIRLLSPQYGSRNLSLIIEAGDTISLGFFTPNP